MLTKNHIKNEENDQEKNISIEEIKEDQKKWSEDQKKWSDDEKKWSKEKKEEIRKTNKPIFVIKDWLVFRGDWTELDKKNNFYIIENPEIIVVDYDKSKLRPFVKSILNKLEIIPELKFLKIILGLTIVFFIFSIIWMKYFSINEEKLLEKINVSIETNIKKITSNPWVYGN